MGSASDHPERTSLGYQWDENFAVKSMALFLGVNLLFAGFRLGDEEDYHGLIVNNWLIVDI
jgi:hypothetical protein